MTAEEIALELRKSERDQAQIDSINRGTRERYDRDGQCCGCSGHAMELRGSSWHCYTCGGPQKGCGR